MPPGAGFSVFCVVRSEKLYAGSVIGCGHCLGTFQTAKLCFGYTPLQTVVSLTTTPQLSSLSLSLRIYIVASS
jgi:hypothetical protein